MRRALNGSRTGARKGRLVLSAAAAVGALLLASCGSDDEGGSSATTAAAGEQTTASTTVAAGSDGAEASSGLEKAKALVAEATARPTSIELATPVGKEIPTGKNIYFVTCGVEDCDLEVPIFQKAIDILGWELTVLNTDGSPQQVQNAWEQIVREKPDGVLYTGTPRSQIDQYITQASANGTAVSACCVTDPAENGLLGVIGPPNEVGLLGEVMAAAVIADSGDTPPGAVYLDLPDFPILSALATEFEASYKEMCPDCAYEKLDFGLADLQGAADQVVSYLRSNPDVKYVAESVSSVFLGLPAALKAAGLNDVKIVGQGVGPAVAQSISSGDMLGGMAFGYYEAMFSMVDVLARKFAGAEPASTYLQPRWLLTAENIPSTTEVFPMVEDIESVFKELWGKS